MENFELISTKGKEISGLGEVCTFNKKKYDFLSIFEENFGSYREWNHSLMSRNRADIEDECYSIIDKKRFKKVYEEFINSINNFFENKYIFQDLGTDNSVKSVNYPDFAHKLCKSFLSELNSYTPQRE